MDGPRAPIGSLLASVLVAFAVGAGSGLLQSGLRPQAVPVGQTLTDLPLYFIENRGQTDPRVSYHVQGQRASFYFTPRGVTMVLADKGENLQASVGDVRSHTREKDAQGLQRWVLRQEFLGVGVPMSPVGRDRTPLLVSYFKGARPEWKTALPTYASVLYEDIWPGIDLRYEGSNGHLKYTFVVKPGADPRDIRLGYRGASRVGLTPQGALEVRTPRGGFREEKPYAYQEVDGRRVEVSAAHALHREAGAHVYGFRVATYDPTKPLVLDPVVLVYAGYIGGEGDDFGNGIAVDASGAAYVTGETFSTETFPEVVGPDLSPNGAQDAFVAKVNPDGTGLVYAGYIGGESSDTGNDIAVDASGAAYVVGDAVSSLTFPVKLGPDLIHNGRIDGFVAKVSPDGTELVYAGYIGGVGDDFGKGVAVDSSGAAYVAGLTVSREDTFPVTVGPDITHNGGLDAFVAKVTPGGTGLVYAGYIGGSGTDVGWDIAMRGEGVYLVGGTQSSEATFPVAVGPDVTYNGGGAGDAFVAEVNPAGTGLDYAGYIGGDRDDSGRGIAVDASGAAYVTGPTNSIESTFPVTGGPDLTYNGGIYDSFVAKVKPGGIGLVYAGYIGGEELDEGYGIAVDASGAAYVIGQTNSTEATFPVTGGPDLTYNGRTDAFVARVTREGSELDYAGYIGGDSLDAGFGITVDASGAAYVAGTTTSTEATFPVTVGPDLTYNGGGEFFVPGDAFVAKIEPPRADLALTKTDSPGRVPTGRNLTYTLTVTNNGPDSAAGVQVTDTLPPSVTFVSATPREGSCTESGGTVACLVGTMQSQGTTTVEIVVRPRTAGTITNTASVSSSAFDPSPGNNFDSEDTTVCRITSRRSSIPCG